MAKPAKIFQFPGTAASGLAPELPLQVPVIDEGIQAAGPLPAIFLDLSKRRKAVLVVGAGGVGKTTLLRWMVDRAFGRDEELDLALATVDPVNRELGLYFPGVHSPDDADSITWLGVFLSWLMETDGSGCIDLGGGDTALAGLFRQMPDLVPTLGARGLDVVVLVMLSPRPADLAALKMLLDAGLDVPALGLVLNLGKMDSGKNATREFAQLRAHSVYRSAVEKGAAEIWMPRNFAATPVENRRLGFRAAVKSDQINVLDQLNTKTWLDQMEGAFRPIATWLP